MSVVQGDNGMACFCFQGNWGMGVSETAGRCGDTDVRRGRGTAVLDGSFPLLAHVGRLDNFFFRTLVVFPGGFYSIAIGLDEFPMTRDASRFGKQVGANMFSPFANLGTFIISVLLYFLLLKRCVYI
jgi:hypothetical protein